jgi:hypothetical protein
MFFLQLLLLSNTEKAGRQKVQILTSLIEHSKGGDHHLEFRKLGYSFSNYLRNEKLSCLIRIYRQFIIEAIILYKMSYVRF